MVELHHEPALRVDQRDASSCFRNAVDLVREKIASDIDSDFSLPGAVNGLRYFLFDEFRDRFSALRDKSMAETSKEPYFRFVKRGRFEDDTGDVSGDGKPTLITHLN